MHRPLPLTRAVLAAALLTTAAAPLRAQGTGEPGWKNTVTVYGWAVQMSGTAGAGPFTATVDVPFSEILDNLKMGGMLNYQGRGEKWVAAADLIYMKLGSDVARPSTGTTLAEVKLKEWLIEGDAGYRVTPWLDALVGLRIPVIVAEIVPDRDNPVISEKSGTESWVAPVIGARAEVPFGGKFTAVARADVGGFDLGGTNMTWQLAGYVTYRFSTLVSGSIGYRALAADYETGAIGEEDRFEYDISNFGPAFGISFTF
ncbi:MAG TPA: hypothetical protein VFV65_05710 [Gemmatimonadales bacterium]|nr:hypothetical protein [Gemmatimonadales bacterium]